MLATGSPLLLRQLRRAQPSAHRVTPLRRYSLSVCKTTRQGCFSASSAAAAAVSSMRLLVVAGSAPESSRSCAPKRRIAAQPPGPGLGLQPPSVQISTRPGSDAVGMLVAGSEMEAQALVVF